ncbi:hypothetical protein BDW62DRAFT_220637 [Aspergillus aurantiobrunneus]
MINQEQIADIKSRIQTQPSPKEDSISSRIPRVTGMRQAANSSAAKGSRSGSSIPIPVHRRSAEQLSATLQDKQSEASPSGIRLFEKPRGPRPRPPTEQTVFSNLESAQGTEQISEPTPLSTSSSSVSSLDIQISGEPERPATIFTGEYRTRNTVLPGHQSPGPTLRIASSAENIIMGGTTQEPSDHGVVSKSSPLLIQRLGKLTPSTPKDTKSPRGITPGSRGTQASKASAGGSKEGTPTSRNFCRPQMSLDSLQKRDISGKEMSIARKPVSKSSISSFFSPSSKSLRSDEEPDVPKIPDQYFSNQKNSVRQVPSGPIEPATPKVTSEPKDTPSSARPIITPLPETAIKIGGAGYPHPPRTSSLRALSDFPNIVGSAQGAALTSNVPSNVVATNFRRNVTFNDIAPLALDNEQHSKTPDRSRLPESRSNHLLGSFRSIFRSRSGAIDKEHAIKEERDDENQAPNIENPVEKENPPPTESEKGPKSKAKYPRLSSGVSWNRSTRNPKAAAESPTTPTPSVPRLLAPSQRRADINIPSFARATKSTRTKATSASKGNVSVTPESHVRRTHVRTASTGSPQRLTRSSKRTASNLLTLSAHKKTNQSPASAAEKKTATAPAVSTDCIPKNLDAFHSCLEKICKKIGYASTSEERYRCIRLALSLQQQLGDYQCIEKIVLEVESLAKAKNLERKAAEESLNTCLAEALVQLEED